MKLDIYDALYKGAFIVRTGPFDVLLSRLKAAGFDTSTIAPPRLAKTMYCEHTTGRDLCVVWFSDAALDSKDLASVMAHEAHHAAWYTLESRGISADEFAGETGAYYTEWLMMEMVNYLRTAHKSRKKR